MKSGATKVKEYKVEIGWAGFDLWKQTPSVVLTTNFIALPIPKVCVIFRAFGSSAELRFRGIG